MELALTSPVDWHAEFPDESLPLAALRQSLIHADQRRSLLQRDLVQLQSQLTALNLPSCYWPATVQKTVHFVEHRYLAAEQTFRRILKALENAMPKHKTIAAAAAAAPTPQPVEPQSPPEIIHRQTAQIKVVDGQTITRIADFDAAYWLRKQPFPEGSVFCRQLVFDNSIVPDAYSYALTEDGETYPPSRAVFIIYSPEEFLRLCQLEIDTQSEHLLDGTRLETSRL